MTVLLFLHCESAVFPYLCKVYIRHWLFKHWWNVFKGDVAPRFWKASWVVQGSRWLTEGNAAGPDRQIRHVRTCGLIFLSMNHSCPARATWQKRWQRKKKSFIQWGQWAVRCHVKQLLSPLLKDAMGWGLCELTHNNYSTELDRWQINEVLYVTSSVLPREVWA